MGLKVDSSFLKFLTMGAAGTRQVQKLMEEAGLQPIELERYSASNKIWATKVKRLRVPDLLCVRTGLRIEVRAKSALAIKMSDSPNNDDRRWFSGLNGDDLVAFIQVLVTEEGNITSIGDAELFRVSDLLETEIESRLGPPKSASEGAERDREWTSTVAKKAGTVTSIEENRFKVKFTEGRNQTYQLRGKCVYLKEGESFTANSQFLAGLPARLLHFSDYRPDEGNVWNPRPLLASESPLDRFVAAKALGRVGNRNDRVTLLQHSEKETDGRVALEAAISVLRLGDLRGLVKVREILDKPAEVFLSMEAILALGEMAGTPRESNISEFLVEIAQNEKYEGDEIRQAAIWGLGKSGLGCYEALLPFLDSPDENEIVHAVCAFGSDLPHIIIDRLVECLVDPKSSLRMKAGAAHVLGKSLPTETVASKLIRRIESASGDAADWLTASLGLMTPSTVLPMVQGSELEKRLALLSLLSGEINWTRTDSLSEQIKFIAKQRF